MPEHRYEEVIMILMDKNCNKRKQDPYLDRRSVEDRRQSHVLEYFLSGGEERRGFKERREPGERRRHCILVTKWTSICPEEVDE